MSKFWVHISSTFLRPFLQLKNADSVLNYISYEILYYSQKKFFRHLKYLVGKLFWRTIRRWSSHFLERIELKLRLEIPVKCSPNVFYSLKYRCPQFRQLRQIGTGPHNGKLKLLISIKLLLMYLYLRICLVAEVLSPHSHRNRPRKVVDGFGAEEGIKIIDKIHFQISYHFSRRF